MNKLQSRSNLLPATSLLLCLITLATQAATNPDPTTQPHRTLAQYALKSADIKAGVTKAYRPWFDNVGWQGDLIEYSIAANGTSTTDVDFSATPPTSAGTNWSVRTAYISAVNGNPAYWTNNRKIITSTSGTNQLAFRWSNLPDPLKLALDSSGNVGAAQNNILDYIRGDRSLESGSLRVRNSIMGDILNSDPVYIGKPSNDFIFPGYAAFKDAPRAGRIYVGANDGMLHVFDETDGSEVYAYIPSMLLNTLKKLSASPYSHTLCRRQTRHW